jgi:hypothetical protein
MTTPTLSSRNEGAVPPDPMRMLASIDIRLMAVEQNLFNVLGVLNAMLSDYRLVENDYRLMPTAGERVDDEARRRGEAQARAIRDARLQQAHDHGEMLAKATRDVSR